MTTTGSPTTDQLRARFAPLLERIHAGAVERERDRRLPFAEIRELAEAGIGRLRLPIEQGGFGAGFDQLTEVLIDVAAADSNIVQALRGHIGFVEEVLVSEDAEYRSFWLREIASGALVGNAETEKTGNYGNPITRIVERDGKLLLNGRKYYTTGTIFADWTRVTAELVGADGESSLVHVAVSTAQPGVTTVDDWDGFGQRLTASGTTTFVDVPVDPRFVIPLGRDRTLIWPIYQLNLLSALVGIAEAATSEIVRFVQAKSRNAWNPLVAPSHDEAALFTVGTVRSRTTLVRAGVLEGSRRVGAALELHRAGIITDLDFDSAEAYVAQLWSVVIEDVLGITSRIFEVGGASATASSRQLDRLWRNARTISSNNPSFHQARTVGDHELNGVPVASFIHAALAPIPQPDAVTA
ncbi:acyl-CoA dehydrogenase family protein [Raineyella sp. W15-4]|uniref:acyl-CoA dehydrogenase family protein n=1 Tax=Raineyella sp. W15-4 TaxID=3081651 RepID=UPI00295441E5|nr:acyl-CoA dehydrogenase family protein [Raineyella sp. W15-4]WOQ18517.1 acyl-CoA dehydrogenase family protein [Raineyella sp. W15-4]